MATQIKPIQWGRNVIVVQYRVHWQKQLALGYYGNVYLFYFRYANHLIHQQLPEETQGRF